MAGRRGALVAVLAALSLACGKSASGTPAGGGVQENQDDGGTSPAADGGATGDGGGDGGADAGAPDGGAPDAGPADGGGADGGGADGGTDGGTDGGVTLTPAPSQGGWTVYGAAQGLSSDVHDASADEGGNVYVAGYDALYVKRPGEPYFHRVDPDAAGLTKSCSTTLDPTNPLDCPNAIPTSQPDALCPVISVAGAAAGQAAVGYQGRGTDGDADLTWCLDSGGVDLVAFDGASVTRTRHVLIASPPGTVCETRGYGPGTPNPCPTWDFTWTEGRRKLRQVYRVVVNHLKGTPQYGDVWMGGTHATFSVLLANAALRGWRDPANQWPDSMGVWEHDHPAIASNSGLFLTGEAWAIAIDPTTGDPWASNGYRTASKAGYGAMPNGGWWQPMWPAYNGTNQQLSYWDVWPDGTLDAIDPAAMDATSAMCFFADGTLWQGSSIHGLVRRAPDGTATYLDLPGGLGNSVGGLGCDDSDGSLWVGFAWGGIGRLKNGAWTGTPAGLSPILAQPVRSVQIDRWSKPRVVWFSHLATKDKTGKVTPGGLTSYGGP
ncbi:hypothetical protein [Anaeromyxobacter paludicola]|uniref:Uncharacterized protein n=1 Tax=Anaeromyxobacter paludicola TaxID=2918171 RepID=A0ABN6N533_9BACT|nr:hypothetical protein [Anaeromyxobacter paludicola]BDG06958.1 hypothetical protein AMPC_00710 [Anaeromyxobacter paludicola]